VGKRGWGVRATMLRKIPSLFLNDASIYSQYAHYAVGYCGTA